LREPSKAIESLATLLEDSDAKPVLVPSRLAPSVIYDLEYRTAVIYLVFDAFARAQADSIDRKISASRLKFLQFLSIRPWLLPAIQEWSQEAEQSSLGLAYSVRIRRGFLSDTAHEDVMNFLVACRVFVRDGGQIALGAKGQEVERIIKEVQTRDLFVSERETIAALGDIKITNNMLEGW
jgi:hypothetical protein